MAKSLLAKLTRIERKGSGRGRISAETGTFVKVVHPAQDDAKAPIHYMTFSREMGAQMKLSFDENKGLNTVDVYQPNEKTLYVVPRSDGKGNFRVSYAAKGKGDEGKKSGYKVSQKGLADLTGGKYEFKENVKEKLDGDEVTVWVFTWSAELRRNKPAAPKSSANGSANGKSKSSKTSKSVVEVEEEDEEETDEDESEEEDEDEDEEESDEDETEEVEELEEEEEEEVPAPKRKRK